MPFHEKSIIQYDILRLLLQAVPLQDPKHLGDINWKYRRLVFFVTNAGLKFKDEDFIDFNICQNNLYLNGNKNCRLLQNNPNNAELVISDQNNLFSKLFFSFLDIWKYLILFF
jgi:hypothetical protein